MPTRDLKQEQALQEEESRIQQQIAFASDFFKGDVTADILFESLAEGVVIIDNSGTILLVNSRAEQMFGYPKNELIGKSHVVLIPERFRKIHEDHQAGFFAKPRNSLMGQRVELTGLCLDGSELPVTISLSFIETINGVFVLAFVNDMSERRQVEQEREKLLVQLDAVLNSINEGVVISDLKGNILTMNPSALAIHEFESVEQARSHLNQYQETFELSYLDRRPVPFNQWPLARVLRGEKFTDYEVRVVRKDSGKSWIASYCGTPVQTKSGDIILSIVTLHDISDRKRTEEALRESEIKFSKAFQATPSVLVIASLEDGRYMEVNECFERVLGYQRDEVVGRSSQDFNIWQNPIDRINVLRMLAEGKKVRGLEIGFRSKSGTILIGLYSAEIIKIGADQCLLSLVSDITVRKKVEEELRHSEDRYRRLYNDTPVMLHSIDPDGLLVSVSNYWLETLGYERNEVLGRISTEFYTAASRSYATAVVLPEFFRTGSCKDVPLQIVKKNGEIMDVLLSATAERDSEGKIFRSLAVMVDVTERKRAEEEIKRLSTVLAARAADLEDANRELETFNYTAAHDLRQPLNIIGLNCQAVDMLCGDELNEECRGYVQEAYNGTLCMTQLIDTLLNFSRLVHIEPHLEMVDLSALAHEVSNMLRVTDPERQVDFRIADGIKAKADANLLQVVLNNLLGNAWKYSGTRKDTVIQFGMTKNNDVPIYFVKDNGTGFDKVHAEKLFTPFQRLPDAEKCKGFGIGLATVERIVRRHGGRIWANGEAGKGATFYFTLSGD